MEDYLVADPLQVICIIIFDFYGISAAFSLSRKCYLQGNLFPADNAIILGSYGNNFGYKNNSVRFITFDKESSGHGKNRFYHNPFMG